MEANFSALIKVLVAFIAGSQSGSCEVVKLAHDDGISPDKVGTPAVIAAERKNSSAVANWKWSRSETVIQQRNVFDQLAGRCIKVRAPA